MLTSQRRRGSRVSSYGRCHCRVSSAHSFRLPQPPALSRSTQGQGPPSPPPTPHLSPTCVALAASGLRPPRAACTAGEAPAATRCCSDAQQRRCSPANTALLRSAQPLRRRRRRPGSPGALAVYAHLSAPSCLRCTLGHWSALHCTWLALVSRARCCSVRTAQLPPPKPPALSVRGVQLHVLYSLWLSLTCRWHSAMRDETERVLAEELAQRCARGSRSPARPVVLLSRAAPARSFRRLPEDEQVALVERLLRRAIASDASSRGVRTELQTAPPPAPPPRQRTDAESDAESAVASRKPQLAPAAAASAPAAGAGVEPTSALDAQDGWDGVAASEAPPLALQLEKLLPSAQARPPLAAARSPAAGAGTVTPTGVTAASPGPAVFDTLFSGSLALRPLTAAAAAGAAVVLGSIAIWLRRERAADATQPQAAPTGDKAQAPPDASVRIAASEGVEAATARRPEVLWSRKEKPVADAPAAEADVAVPSVLWKRGAPRTKLAATEEAATSAGDAKEQAAAVELSDNAEGLRFGARLKQPPK